MSNISRRKFLKGAGVAALAVAAAGVLAGHQRRRRCRAADHPAGTYKNRLMTHSLNRTQTVSGSAESFKCFWPLVLMQQA